MEVGRPGDPVLANTVSTEVSARGFQESFLLFFFFLNNFIDFRKDGKGRER